MMYWCYKLVEKTESQYIYAYSRGNKELDGLICYDINTKKPTLIRACAADVGMNRSSDGAIARFRKVVKRNFPAECSVCCG